MTRFNWTPERLADLRRLYLDEQRGPVEIARYFGDGCNCVTISSAVRIHGMKRPRTASNGFNWTPQATDALRRMYPDQTVTCAIIARKIGNGCTERAVIRKAALLKLASPRTRVPGVKRIARVQRIRPMSPDKARFIGWFRRAGWPASEVAWLFDVQPEQVAA
jgi:hypothetical protein